MTVAEASVESSISLSLKSVLAILAEPSVVMKLPTKSIPGLLPFRSTNGASLMGLTVRIKLADERADPSVTDKPIVVDPCLLGAGVILIVRLLPLPPSTILPAGTRV